VSFARNPKYFPAILEYLASPTARSWVRHAPNEASALELLEDAKYYGLVGLEKEVSAFLSDLRNENLFVGVGRRFVTIAAAIAASSRGQRILVEPGTYEECLEITKDISLIAIAPACAPRPPLTAASARGPARNDKNFKGSEQSVVIQFASNAVVSVSGSVVLENIAVRRIMRTGFDRKNVFVDLQEERVTQDNVAEHAGAAVRVVGGGRLKMQNCNVASHTDSMLSIDAGCSVEALNCTFSTSRGPGISCRGLLKMHSCSVSRAEGCAIVVELGSLIMDHCQVSASACSCIISRSSSISCAHSTFSGGRLPCIQLLSVGALTSDIFNCCLQSHAPSSNTLDDNATLARNGFDSAAVALLLAKFQSLSTAAAATSSDLRSLSVKQLKERLVIGEALFKNCVVNECSSSAIVCCGGSLRMIEVSILGCERLALLLQDQAKVSMSSCIISNCAGCAVWARSRAVVMVVGLQLRQSAVCGLVVDGLASLRLVDSSISASGRSAVSVIHGAVHMRGVHLAHNKRCGLETCCDDSCSALLKEFSEDLQLFKPLNFSNSSASPPPMLLELQACHITSNGDGIIIASRRKCFDAEPLFECVEFSGNNGYGCSLLTASCCPAFRNCVFRDNAQCGVRFHLQGRAVLSSCRIESNGSCALHVLGLGSFCSLRDCDISNHADAGIMFEESSGGDVQDSRIVNNSTAVIVTSHAAPVMSRCLLSKCTGTAMVCGQSAAGKFDTCAFIDNLGLAVSIEQAARPHLQSCSFGPAADSVNAITCCSGSGGNISNCTFDNVGLIAVAMQRDSDVRVTHCFIKGCAQFGVLCMPGSKGSLEYVPTTISLPRSGFCKYSIRYNNVSSCWRASCAIMSNIHVPSATKLVGNSFDNGMDGSVAVYGAARS
jgi:hypothetical protein